MKNVYYTIGFFALIASVLLNIILVITMREAEYPSNTFFNNKDALNKFVEDFRKVGRKNSGTSLALDLPDNLRGDFTSCRTRNNCFYIYLSSYSALGGSHVLATSLEKAIPIKKLLLKDLDPEKIYEMQTLDENWIYIIIS